MFERTDFSSGQWLTDLASEMESPAKRIRTPMLIRKAAKGGAYNSVRLLSCAGMVGRPRSTSTPGRDRTCNLRIRSPLLYPLSYGR